MFFELFYLFIYLSVLDTWSGKRRPNGYILTSGQMSD